MTIREHNLILPQAQIAEFCRKNGIAKLSLFGSVLRADFRPDSDVDVLVEFLPGRTPGLFRFLGMRDELADAIGRAVDLRTPEDLHPRFRDRVVQEAEVQFAANCERLEDMIEYTRQAMSFAEGRVETSLAEDRQFELATMRRFEIIGEAAMHVSQQTRDRLPKVPWRAVIGMRNHLIHGYHGISMAIVWKTIQEDLPALVQELEGYLSTA